MRIARLAGVVASVVFMAQTPGPIRTHYRTLVRGLVYQAIVD